MRPVKGDFAQLSLLLRLLSPWREKSLAYGELAEKMGAPFTEEAVKSWSKRGRFSSDGRERLSRAAY